MANARKEREAKAIRRDRTISLQGPQTIGNKIGTASSTRGPMPADACGQPGCCAMSQSTWKTSRSRAVDAHGRQLAAPDATGVEPEQVGSIDQAERRPVAEGDRRSCACAGPARRTREEAGRRGVGAVLGLAKSSVPSAVTKRIRVSVLRVKRSRPSPASESLQRTGSLPNMASRNRAAASCAERAPARRRAPASAPGPIAAPRRHAASASRARAPPCAAGGATRARPRGRAHRGCRRACRSRCFVRTPAATASRCQSWLPSRQVADVAETAQQAQRRERMPGRG